MFNASGNGNDVPQCEKWLFDWLERRQKSFSCVVLGLSSSSSHTKVLPSQDPHRERVQTILLTNTPVLFRLFAFTVSFPNIKHTRVEKCKLCCLCVYNFLRTGDVFNFLLRSTRNFCHNS